MSSGPAPHPHPHLMRLDSVRLVTRDLPTLARFYEQVLDTVAVGTDDFVELRTSGAILAICTEQTVETFNRGAASAEGNRSSILEFQGDEVDAHEGRLRATLGDHWKRVQEPTDQPWGNRSMLFRDPDGNLINFFSRSTTARDGAQAVQSATAT